MTSVFERLQNRAKKDKNRSHSSIPTPSVGQPSTREILGDSAHSLDLITTPIANQTDERPSETKRLYIAAGITALKHLKEIGEAGGLLGPLKAACGATTVILETIEAMDSNKEAWKSTLHTIQRHQQMFDQQLEHMNAQDVLPNAEAGLLNPIKTYGEDLESILGALMLENGISATTVPQNSRFRNLATFMKRYGTVKVEAETIGGYANQLDDAMKQFVASMTVYMGFKLHSVGQDLQKLVLSSSNEKRESAIVKEIKLKPRPRLSPNFIGREKILEAMQEVHFSNVRIRQQTPVITILSGIGGLGKTQTALKFALGFEEKNPDVPVFFLDASSPEKLQNDLETVIRSFGTAYHAKSYQDALVWLATELKNWLVILDNADDPNVDLVHHIPHCAHGHVIITTRNATLAALAPNSSHALEGLTAPDAITLLLKASNYPNDGDNQRQAAMIVLELGSLPLALDYAAGYILVHRCLGTYLDMYRKNREKILASTNSRSLHEYPSSVAMTIKMSFEKLSERAQNILRLFAHLQATFIPLSMIVKAAERRFRRVQETEEASLKPETLKHADGLMKVFCPGGEWSEFDFNDSIHECLQYSLLQLTTHADEKFYSMHVLVQPHLQGDALVHGHQPKQLISRLLGSAVTIGNDYEFLAFNRTLLPHIRLLKIEEVTEPGDHYGLGYVLNEVGDVRLALVHREKCAEMWRELLGKEDERTIAAMEYLAVSYSLAGKNQSALELQEEVLSLRWRLLGPEHPATVRAMGNLAISYLNMGRNEAALELLEQVLLLRKRLLGPEHPDTVRTMGDLAVSYTNLGKNQAALELQEEVLSLRRRILGPEDPDTVQAMGNLAASYTNVGKNQAALELQEQVLSLRRRLLGPEHPDTVQTMGNLAISYMKLGNNHAALELQEEVLSLRWRLLGPEHPATMRTIDRLASSYKNIGKNQAALDLRKDVLSLRKRLLGPEHLDTVSAMGNLAASYMIMGKKQEAQELQEQVLSLQKRLLGWQHPEALKTMRNLLITYQHLDMQAQRLNLLTIAVSAHETAESFGVNHPKTVELRDSLNRLLDRHEEQWLIHL